MFLFIGAVTSLPSVSLNEPGTPLAAGADPSILFSGSVEKVQQYLERHGPFRVLAQLGPQCYTNLPDTCLLGDTRVFRYWPKNSPRNPDPSLRLIKVVSVESCSTDQGVVPVVSYRVREDHIEQNELYITSYENFCKGLAAVKDDPNYQALLTADLSCFPSYEEIELDFERRAEPLERLGRDPSEALPYVPKVIHTPESRRINEIGQRLFDRYLREARHAVKARAQLVDLHASLPKDRRDAIEQAWDGVGIGERGLRDPQNWRWRAWTIVD